ncbi:Rab1a [Spironucleus salmonicida]|uniref:Rab1a n=1 Tax=Spironucleus salmonicida TaxID=348837 RepID=V6LY14_9EUKA|nr:Rab1a [Spironucleus salmonicida]|eukprot:EST45669.1 Rab1a [Spironucleus salmonicida]
MSQSDLILEQNDSEIDTIREKSEDKVEEKSEDKVEEKSEDKVEEKSEAKVEEKSEDKVEEKSEDKVEEKSEDKVEEKSEDKVEEKSEDKVEEKSEAKVEEKSEDKVEEKSEDKVEEKSEAKVEEKSEDKVEEKSEDKVEEKSEAKVEEKSEAKVEEKSEAKVEEKSEDKVEEKSEAKAEEKSEAKVENIAGDSIIVDHSLLYEAPSYSKINSSIQTRLFKVALIGDSNTGKTSIFQRWQNDSFNENNVSTIGSDQIIKEFGFNDKFNVKCVIYDTAGQEQYKATTTATVRSANFVVFVFSYDNKKSFENINIWMKEIKQINTDLIPILIGNKSDLEKQVSAEEVEAFITNNNIQSFYGTSCKVGFGVHKILTNLKFDQIKYEEQVNVPVISKPTEPITGEKKSGCC